MITFAFSIIKIYYLDINKINIRYQRHYNGNQKIVVGRDGRISGSIVSNLAVNTLLSMGIDVVDLGLSTTPTVEMIVPKLNAGAGIIFTASHNPKEWNALKFLTHTGEFISGEDGLEVLKIIEGAKRSSELGGVIFELSDLRAYEVGS